MLKENLKVRFEDLDPCEAMKGQCEFFINVLSKKYNVTVLNSSDDEEPDLLLYSWWGSNNLKWQKCVRIYYTIEMDYPDFNICDYAIGLSIIDIQDRFFRLPVYIIYDDLLYKYEKHLNNPNNNNLFNRKFCSTIVTNGKLRDPFYFELLKRLNCYNKVYSGGRFNNNIGTYIHNKVKFIQNFKFNLSIENSNIYGYVTEKIIESFIADSIPIYWGSNYVKTEFGTSGYINLNEFSNINDAISQIKKINENKSLYLDIVCQKPNLKISKNEWECLLLDFFVNALSKGKRTNFDLMINKMYYERFTFYRLRNSYIGKIYRAFKSR